MPNSLITGNTMQGNPKSREAQERANGKHNDRRIYGPHPVTGKRVYLGLAEVPPHLSPALTGRQKSATPKFESAKWATANVKLTREYEKADADHEKSTVGYVYIITNDIAFPGMVKIGETGTTPQSRAANAATWCPIGTFKVIDARLVDDRHDFEDRMHRMLDGFHVRGEWFKCSVELATNMLHSPVDEHGEAA